MAFNLCRFDISQDTCQNCIVDAADTLVNEGKSNKTAIIWFDGFMVRYSNRSFSSALESNPAFYMWNVVYVTQPDEFGKILTQTLIKRKADGISSLVLEVTQHYLVENKLGEGGFGPVYEMRNLKARLKTRQADWYDAMITHQNHMEYPQVIDDALNGVVENGAEKRDMY
ncbi:hypothetical protein Dsin_027836 [Dipteronia sinensis]|uniref:Gnk2-homologous domain-containing protein n=1 Tax=Dipteronia sinensis TaxID=43782 RepID=A0AAE0DTV0_9ROSI|nr:hypothetical protein Dsin_027836 [Dipteronia sinensis]